MPTENNPHAVCGARARTTGKACQSRPMANGKCRMHGGVSSGAGAPEGNKNAVTTGEFESIWLDTLEDDEKALIQQVKTDEESQLDEQMRLTTIRIRRMMKRIQFLKTEGMHVVEEVFELGDGEETGPMTKQKRHGNMGLIQNIEEALTRVQAQAISLIDKKHRIRMDSKDDGNGDDVLAGLVDALNRSREA